MRKTTVAILMGMVMTVLLAGCAGGEGSEERKNSEASEEAAVVIRDSAEKETPGESVEADPDNVADSEETEETLPEESQVAETAEVSSYEEPFGEEISIDPDTQKKMNIFLSNFSEAGLYEYDQDHVDLYDIFRWVERWTKMNNYQGMEYGPLPGDDSGESYEKISLQAINKATEKYLGLTITDQEASEMEAKPEGPYLFVYKDGYLYAPAADGEAHTYFSVVSQAEDLGDQKLKLYYNIFSQDLDAYFEGKEIDYSLTSKEATDDPEYEKIDAGYAVVRIEDGVYKLEHLE